MMKKILKLGIILIILSVVSGCRNNDESLNQKSGKVIENTNVKMELEVRKKANDLFNRLIESGQFNEFEFINFENVIGWTSNTTRETIRYEVRYSKK